MTKILASLLLVSVLSGCAVVEKVSAIWPRAHDPALVSGWVDLDVALSKANCSDRESLEPAIKAADWLNRYSLFRDDPQKITTKLVVENLVKARNTPSEKACETFVRLTIINTKTIKTSWSGR